MDAGRIIICDDEAPLRKMLSEHLSECGFTITEAANAAELAARMAEGEQI